MTAPVARYTLSNEWKKIRFHEILVGTELIKIMLFSSRYYAVSIFQPLKDSLYKVGIIVTLFYFRKGVDWWRAESRLLKHTLHCWVLFTDESQFGTDFSFAHNILFFNIHRTITIIDSFDNFSESEEHCLSELVLMVRKIGGVKLAR